MTGNVNLPLIDVSSPDTKATSNLIRRACLEHGFFYVVNHGIEDELITRVFAESKKFFDLPLEEKMKLEHDENHRGYTPVYAETLDTSVDSPGDLKETFYIGPMEDKKLRRSLNQWPSEETLSTWRSTMESFYEKLLNTGKKLVSLVALALYLEDDFFEKVGAQDEPMPFLRLLHYPGYQANLGGTVPGASAHSDYGMLTLLVANNIAGLQICREKHKEPRVWEDVHHIDGAFVVNVGDLLERWTNCVFRSTLHRVVSLGPERYSVAFFLDPNSECVVECLESCCSESSPPRFPPIRSGDYLKERLAVSYASK